MNLLQFPEGRPPDIDITAQLYMRPCKPPLLASEAKAASELARLVIENPTGAIDAFLQTALTLCDAGSAGLSVLEAAAEGKHQFRWRSLAGAVSEYVGGTTPRDFSPCGMCLDAGRTILVSEPLRKFEYFRSVKQPLREALIVPLYDTGRVPLGTLWVVHHDPAKHFDAEDARVMEQLAVQLVLALKREKDDRQQVMSAEREHRGRNILAIVQALVSQTLRNASTLEGAREATSARLAAFAAGYALVQHDTTARVQDIVRTALAIHGPVTDRVSASGPEVILHPVPALALSMALHELCSNAIKHGALRDESGRVRIDWEIVERDRTRTMQFRWVEMNGTPIAPPERKGFGSLLLETLLSRELRGKAELRFEPAGVVWVLQSELR